MSSRSEKTVSPFMLHSRLLSSIFLLGAFATLSQVLFLREMLVVFFGNELVIGTILAGWFVGISLGAFCSRFLPVRLFVMLSLESFIQFVFMAMALLLPFQLYIIRIIRQILDVPVGGYA